jgi:hypothetical protein
MAGTLITSTIQGTTLTDGTNSTSTTNCIKGSAKAWVNYNGVTQTVNSSFNVLTVTYVSTGTYTVNFTTAMPNAFFVTQLTGNNSGARSNTFGYTTAQTTSSVSIKFADDQSTLTDVSSANVAIFSS